MPSATGFSEKLCSSFRRWREQAETTRFSSASKAFALTALIALYFLVTNAGASRLLWHDELFTVYIAAASSWSKLWKEIPLDLNPPLEFVLVRLSTSLFGLGNYAIRLPSIIAFLAGSCCLYAFVARRLGASHGVLAISVFWASPFFFYATEARPYALLTGFLGLTLVAWDYATRTGRRLSAVMLLSLAVIGMMFSHLMALFYVVPFCMAELARIWKTRRIDFVIWAALLVPCAIPFVYLPLMTRFGESAFPLSFQASIWHGIETYYGTLKTEALPLLIGIGLASFAVWVPDSSLRRKAFCADVVSFALTAGFLLEPLIINLALMRSHGAYFDRYSLPVEFGYALLIPYIWSLLTSRARMPAWIGSAFLLLFVVGYNWATPTQSVWTRKAGKSEHFLAFVHPDLPLVAASGLTFVELDHYGDPAVVDRLYYLTDRDKAMHYAHATIFEGMRDLKEWFPIRAHVEPYSEFVSSHPSFLVLGTPDYPEDWLLRALLDGRAKLQYLGDVGGPYKDHQLYLAVVPKH